MSFNLFGFDFLPKDKIFGVWFFNVKNYEEINHSLFCIHYSENDRLFIDLCFYRIHIF